MKIFRSVMNAFWGVKNADPAVMPAKTILKMATENGAHLLGEEKSGVLKEGFKADLISTSSCHKQSGKYTSGMCLRK